MSRIGLVLRYARTQLGFTMGDAAKANGCSVTHISNVELGRSNRAELEAYAEWLEARIDERRKEPTR